MGNEDCTQSDLRKGKELTLWWWTRGYNCAAVTNVEMPGDQRYQEIVSQETAHTVYQKRTD